MDQPLDQPITVRVEKVPHGHTWKWTADGPWGHTWGIAPTRQEALSDAIDYLQTSTGEVI